MCRLPLPALHSKAFRALTDISRAGQRLFLTTSLRWTEGLKSALIDSSQVFLKPDFAPIG
jgi:hypothetical protein